MHSSLMVPPHVPLVLTVLSLAQRPPALYSGLGAEITPQQLLAA
jgi:hypothetical protein